MGKRTFEPSMIPSPAEIEAAKTPRGGWTRATLATWGVPWPPPKGWRKALEAGQCKLRVQVSPIDEPIRIEFEEPIAGLTLRTRHDAELALSILAKAGVAIKAAEPEFQDIVIEVLGESEGDTPPWN
jgi:hypothetical protein